MASRKEKKEEVKTTDTHTFYSSLLEIECRQDSLMNKGFDKPFNTAPSFLIRPPSFFSFLDFDTKDVESNRFFGVSTIYQQH
jgi:hypothetical protein